MSVRRLPVYLVLDTSGSMQGTPIDSVLTGLEMLRNELNINPHALETVRINIISFNDQATQDCVMKELKDFQVPNLQASGTTSLGSAITMLADSIRRDVQQRVDDSARGDWKPLVFLMTDGQPTDDWDNSLKNLDGIKFGAFVCCAAGQQADHNVLIKITDAVNAKPEAKKVLALDTADGSQMAAFFKWVTQSVNVTSQNIENIPVDGEVDSQPSVLPPTDELQSII